MLRRNVLRKLLVNLIRQQQLSDQNLENVIDLGSYEGSSTQALIDVGAKKIKSVDKNPIALEQGTKTGYIKEPIESDMADFVAQIDKNFHGTITAFNCLLYLPHKDLFTLIHNLGNKLAPGSKFIFTFSKTQEKWVDKLPAALDKQFSVSVLTELTRGELDYYCLVATKKHKGTSL